MQACRSLRKVVDYIKKDGNWLEVGAKPYITPVNKKQQKMEKYLLVRELGVAQAAKQGYIDLGQVKQYTTAIAIIQQAEQEEEERKAADVPAELIHEFSCEV